MRQQHQGDDETVVIVDLDEFVEFRGPVGSELEQALDALLAGEQVPVAQVASSGEAVTYGARAAHQQDMPSYEQEIAPIERNLVQNWVRFYVDGFSAYVLGSC